MDAMFSVILVVHILVGVAVCGLVLMQHGKGADMGAAFGSGASGSLFGATGSANFLSRTTAVLAAVFFVTSLALAYIASNKPKTSGSLIENAVQSQSLSAPVPKEEKAAENKAATPDSPESKAKDIPK
ncbi:preprotein translocase subunit SecG [Azospira restricta]|uniref:Protein-export membrane protein SecG n=1 Tax=Azospira restricta TaxID=404405 RepID=A0A974SN16_9RHOO|nr:preprotein translocase subunit SecG [Azospira restricta]QRJ63235.1 preprotein translocase subunit SecG [Azospira restricta]